MGYENRAGEKDSIVIVTDLLDPIKYPAEEVMDLYYQRWQIELKFRDVKTQMQMEHFAVKTPEMAASSLKMMVIGYNLIRCVIQESAEEVNVPVNQMSVTGVRYAISSSQESFRAVAGRPRKHAQLYEKLIVKCSEYRLKIRPFRQEPRARKRRPKNSQLLTKHRSVFKEIQHRSRYRKCA